MTGDRRPEKIVRDLVPLEKHGIDVVVGEVTEIRADERLVRAGDTTITADYLVIALGADLDTDRFPGLAEVGHNLYTLDGAVEIRDSRAALKAGRLAVLVSSMPFKCPAAPYEAALLLDHDLRRRGVRSEVSVDVYSPEPGPMGVAGPEMSGAVRQMMSDRGISYHPLHPLEAVDPATSTLRFSEGRSAQFDYLVFVPPHVAPRVVREAGMTNESGWVPVDRNSMETRFPGVYAIGDITTIPLSIGLPLPKAGTFASSQAEAVAETIAHNLAGKGHPGSFDGHGACFIETGGGKAGMGSGNFYAEPRPAVNLRKPGRVWHYGKVFFERRWLRRWV
jgi:sulfide:quinone oxidoreductase